MEEIFLQVLNLSLSAIPLIIGAIIFRYIFKKAPKWLMGIMWAIVAIRLIVPIQIDADISFLPDIGGAAEKYISEKTSFDSTVTTTEHYYEPADNTDVPQADTKLAEKETGVEVDYLPNEAITTTPVRKNIFVVLSKIWMSGMMLLLVYAVFSYLSLKKRTSASIRTGKDERVYICDEINEPFVLGIIKPAIFLPTGFDDENTKNVLAHEKAHIERFDHLRKLLGFLILTIHWFNPLVWAAYMFFSRDIELACDEKVIRDMSLDEKKAYATSLLLYSTQKRYMFAYPLTFGEKNVKARVKNVLGYKKPAILLVICGIAVCSVLGVASLVTSVNVQADDTKMAEDLISETKPEAPVMTTAAAEIVQSNKNNHYYNISAKECKGKVFVETPDGIYLAEKEKNTFKKVLDENYSLGTIGNNGIYLCESIEEGEKIQYNLAFMNADDYNISLLAENIDLTGSNGVSHYVGMHTEGKHLYIEGTDTFTMYFLRSDTEVVYEGAYKNLINHYYPLSAVYSAGIVNAYMTDRDEHLIGNLQIELADGEYNTIKEVSDVMLTSHGALVKKSWDDSTYNSVYLISYYSGEEKLVYNSEEHDGLYAGYNTYDDNGFYGLQYLGENKYAIIFCGWDGSFKKLYSFSTKENVVGPQMSMSIIGDWLYFYDLSDYQMKRINTIDLNIETIM